MEYISGQQEFSRKVQGFIDVAQSLIDTKLHQFKITVRILPFKKSSRAVYCPCMALKFTVHSLTCIQLKSSILLHSAYYLLQVCYYNSCHSKLINAT